MNGLPSASAFSRGDLGLEARHLSGQRGEVGSGEGRIEPCQQLAGLHLAAFAHVDRAHDRCLQRLHHDGGRLRDHEAARGDHLVDRDQARAMATRMNDHARDDPDDAARRARNRRVDDGRRRPLEFEDDRQRRIVRLAAPTTRASLRLRLCGRRLDSILQGCAGDQSRGASRRTGPLASRWRFCCAQSWR